jgi:2-polyprenyl-3-methyl-5-hydroxy-6-metoxy-1,4-benzoquinol methylase
MEHKHQHSHGEAPFDWNDIYTGDVTDCGDPDPLVLETIAGLPTRGRALDVGCGAGGLVLALARGGWEVTGIDIAANAIQAARKVMDRHGVEAQLHAADAATWQPTKQYDLITNCFALPNTKSGQLSAMRMMQQALAPGGTLILKDFDASMRRPEFAGFHLTAVDELTAGFDQLEIVRAEVVPTPVHHHGNKEAAAANEQWTAAFLVARKRTG